MGYIIKNIDLHLSKNLFWKLLYAFIFCLRQRGADKHKCSCHRLAAGREYSQLTLKDPLKYMKSGAFCSVFLITKEQKLRSNMLGKI